MTISKAVDPYEPRYMNDDWGKVCDALGEPHIIDGHQVSYTHRQRAWWTNLRPPVDYLTQCKPLDADECLDEGRTMQRYQVRGESMVRPLGGSYTAGTDEKPVSTSNRSSV